MPLARQREPRDSLDATRKTAPSDRSPFQRWEAQRDRWKTAERARRPGFGGTTADQKIARAAILFGASRLDMPRKALDGLEARWGGSAAEMSAWAELIPSVPRIKLATNFPRRIDLVDSTLHEVVHLGQKRIGRLPPRFLQDPGEHRRVEAEAKTASAALLDRFLEVVSVDVNLHEPHEAHV